MYSGDESVERISHLYSHVDSNAAYWVCPKQNDSIQNPWGYQLTRMCSSRSAVMMYLPSGVRRKDVSREVCPRTRVPLEVGTWDAREFLGVGGFSWRFCFLDFRFFVEGPAEGSGSGLEELSTIGEAPSDTCSAVNFDPSDSRVGPESAGGGCSG